MSTDSQIIAASPETPSRFAEIFERHAYDIAGFVTSRVGRDEKDDVLSETFLAAFRSRRRFDHREDSAKPWLLGIATRIIRRHRAAEAARWRSLAAASSICESASPCETEAVVERLSAEARVSELQPLLARLSRRDRDTLLLFAWGDLTYEQIAEALNVPVGTVRSRLNRIRTKLSAPPLLTRSRPTGRHGKERGNGSYEQTA